MKLSVKSGGSYINRNKLEGRQKENEEKGTTRKLVPAIATKIKGRDTVNGST